MFRPQITPIPPRISYSTSHRSHVGPSYTEIRLDEHYEAPAQYRNRPLTFRGPQGEIVQLRPEEVTKCRRLSQTDARQYLRSIGRLK